MLELPAKFRYLEISKYTISGFMKNTHFAIKAKYGYALKQLARFYGSEAILEELKSFREYGIISCEEHERVLKGVLLLMKSDSELIAHSLAGNELVGVKAKSELQHTAEYAKTILRGSKCPEDAATAEAVLSESGRYLIRKTKKVYKFWYKRINNEMFKTAMLMDSRNDSDGLESMIKSMQEYRDFIDSIKSVLKAYGPAEKNLLRR